MFILRPLTETDSIEQLTALLHRAYAQLAAMGLRYTAVDQSAAVTRRRIAGGFCLLAWRESELAGTITVHHPKPASHCPQFRQPDSAVLMQFGVDPAWQGLGLGSLLMDAAEGWARSQGYLRVRLDTAESAAHLLARYGKRGYRVEEPLQWPDKAYASVVMVKELHALATARTPTRAGTS